MPTFPNASNAECGEPWDVRGLQNLQSQYLHEDAESKAFPKFALGQPSTVDTRSLHNPELTVPVAFETTMVATKITARTFFPTNMIAMLFRFETSRLRIVSKWKL